MQVEAQLVLQKKVRCFKETENSLKLLTKVCYEKLKEDNPTVQVHTLGGR